MTTIAEKAKLCVPKKIQCFALHIETQEILDSLVKEKPNSVFVNSEGTVYDTHSGVLIEIGDWVIWDHVNPDMLSVYNKDSIFDYIDFV